MLDWSFKNGEIQRLKYQKTINEKLNNFTNPVFSKAIPLQSPFF